MSLRRRLDVVVVSIAAVALRVLILVVVLFGDLLGWRMVFGDVYPVLYTFVLGVFVIIVFIICAVRLGDADVFLERVVGEDHRVDCCVVHSVVLYATLVHVWRRFALNRFLGALHQQRLRHVILDVVGVERHMRRVLGSLEDLLLFEAPLDVSGGLASNLLLIINNQI